MTKPRHDRRIATSWAATTVAEKAILLSVRISALLQAAMMTRGPAGARMFEKAMKLKPKADALEAEAVRLTKNAMDA